MRERDSPSPISLLSLAVETQVAVFVAVEIDGGGTSAVNLTGEIVRLLIDPFVYLLESSHAAGRIFHVFRHDLEGG